MNFALGITKQKVISSDVYLAKKGNEKAFCRLIDSNRMALIRVAKGILEQDMDVEDAIQEAVIKAFKSINKLNKEEFFKTWLIRILINESNKILKKRKNTISLDEVELKDYSSVEALDSMTLMEAINMLDRESRIITILYYFEDLSYKDIADLLNVAEGTVKSRLSRARTKLYGLLK